jgi:DNA polymerase III delta prime subunit
MTAKKPKTAKKTKAVQADVSWAGRFRPDSIEDLGLPPKTLDSLRSLVRAPPKALTVILTGPSGTGKTTTARILAGAFSRGQPQDVVEHNASEDRAVDSIRKLIGFGDYMPSSKVGSRVIILDEVQALVGSGGNAALSALLRPLEDVSKRLVWILCTDQPHTLPQTILSRGGFRIDLSPPTQAAVAKRIIHAIDETGSLLLWTEAKDRRALAEAQAALAGGNYRMALNAAQATVLALEEAGFKSWSKAKIAGYPMSIPGLDVAPILGAAEHAIYALASAINDGKTRRAASDAITKLMADVGKAPEPESVLQAFAEAASNIACDSSQDLMSRRFSLCFCGTLDKALSTMRPGATWAERRVRMLSAFAALPGACFDAGLVFE